MSIKMNGSYGAVKFTVVTPRIVSPAGVVPRIHMPSGAIAVLGEARRRGHEVELIDSTAEGIRSAMVRLGRIHLASHELPVEEQPLGGERYWKTGMAIPTTIEMVARSEPDVIGISCATVADRGETRLLASEIRRAFPDRPIVVGGYEASEWYRSILGESPYAIETMPGVDYVVVGPGQPVVGPLLDYLAAGASGTPPKGVAWRDGSTVRYDGKPTFDPNDYALPAYDLLPHVQPPARDKPIDIYSMFGNPHAGVLADLLGSSETLAYLPLYTSYGCGFDCAFCDVDKILVRYSNANVMTMVESFSSLFGVDYVDLIDNNFAGGRAESRNIAFENLRSIASLNLGVGFSNGLTFESMNRQKFQLLELLAELGNVRHISFPCENGNDRVLRMVHKPHNTALINRVTTRARELLPSTNREGFFIGGFPDTYGQPAESPQEVATTLTYMEHLLANEYLHQAIFLTLSPITVHYRTLWREKYPEAPFEHCLFSRTTSIWPYGDEYLFEMHQRAKIANAELGRRVTRRFNYRDVTPVSEPYTNSLF